MTISAVCVGDNCVDHYLPPVDRRYIGGNAVNVAVSLQRSGIPTAYVGVVGNDPDGGLTLRRLKEQGVDTSRVQVLPGQTAHTHIRLTSSGERQFVHEYLGPRPALELDEPSLEFISRHDLVHNTMAGGTEAYFSLFKRTAGLIVSLDYGERSHPEFIARTLSFVDLAFFSMGEHQRDQAEELARNQFSHGPRLVVVTLGTGGSLAYDGAWHYQPAVPVQVVDTLGAGDSYIGTFLAYWLKGSEIPLCMQKASTAAAETCTHFGGWPQPENPKSVDLSTEKNTSIENRTEQA